MSGDKVQDAFEYVQRLADTTKATNEFKVQVEKYGISYACQWAQAAVVNVELATYWAGVLRVMDNGYDLIPALDVYVEEVTTQLVENMLRGGSSSEFSNAVEAAKREAASRFVREASSMARSLKK